jgi:hypothetical protein
MRGTGSRSRSPGNPKSPTRGTRSRSRSPGSPKRSDTRQAKKRDKNRGSDDEVAPQEDRVAVEEEDGDKARNDSDDDWDIEISRDNTQRRK